MKIRAVLFDFDGTLADTLNNHYKAAMAVFVAEKKTPPFQAKFLAELRPPFADCYRSYGITMSNDEIWQIYNVAYNHENVKLFPDTLEILTSLRKTKWVIVISARPDKELILSCFETNLNQCADLIIGGHEHKLEAINKIMAQNSFLPKESVFVSDFGPDLEAVEPSGVVLLGITRGIHNEQTLRAAGAIQCFPDLAGVKEFVSGN